MSTTTSPLAVSSAEAAARCRPLADRLRLSVIESHRAAGGGHLGSSLSIVEILTAVLSQGFQWTEEDDDLGGDRFVLSKGHAALALYCTLALLGRIGTDRLATFGSNGSLLEPHPNETAEPSLHASTGSLGQGLSIGVGLALGSRLRGRDDERTYVLIGDGEVNEGQIWEAARVAVKLRLSNLIVVLDDNGMQQDGRTDDILPVPDAADCWARMGWDCAECDGHDLGQLCEALEALRDSPTPAPHLLHARTVKGRGVDFLEGRTESHFPPPLTAADLSLVRYHIGGG
jgi:transketolase